MQIAGEVIPRFHTTWLQVCTCAFMDHKQTLQQNGKIYEEAQKYLFCFWDLKGTQESVAFQQAEEINLECVTRHFAGIFLKRKKKSLP